MNSIVKRVEGLEARLDVKDGVPPTAPGISV